MSLKILSYVQLGVIFALGTALILVAQKNRKLEDQLYIAKTYGRAVPSSPVPPPPVAAKPKRTATPTPAKPKRTATPTPPKQVALQKPIATKKPQTVTSPSPANKTQVTHKKPTHVISQNQQKERSPNALHSKSLTKELGILVKNMMSRYEKKNKITWYYNKDTPKSIAKNYLYLYLAKSPSNNWLRLRVQGGSDTPLDTKEYVFYVDNQEYRINLTSQVVGNKKVGSQTWEWTDFKASAKELQILNAIARSQKAVIRYVGANGSKSRKITLNEKNSLKKMLRANEILNRL